MPELERYFLMFFGAVLALVGIILFARRSGSGQNKIKFLGAEFELSAPSLVIFVLGCLLIVFPYLHGSKTDKGGSGQEENSNTSLAQVEKQDSPEVAAKQDELMRKLAEMEKKLNAKQSIQPANTNTPPVVASTNISGEWISEAGDGYVFVQVGNRVTFREVNMLSGVTAAGEGTINGRNVNLVYTTFVGTTGSARLVVGEDADEMTGSFTDNVSRVTQNIYLSR